MYSSLKYVSFPPYQSVILLLEVNILVVSQASLRASSLLHNRLFVKVFNSPMRYFESTPIGRILNIFSRDLDESKYLVIYVSRLLGLGVGVFARFNTTPRSNIKSRYSETIGTNKLTS